MGLVVLSSRITKLQVNMLFKGFLRHKTPENIIRKDVEFSTPFPLFSNGLIYSWRVAPQQSSFPLQSNKAKISNLNYIYNVSKLVNTYHKWFLILILTLVIHSHSCYNH